MSFNSQAWIAIALAIIATFMWRILGVLIYKKVNSESVLMRLINMLAYSLLGSVMMMLMINPTGLLASSELSHRLIGLVVGIGLLFWVRKLPVALFGAITSFGVLSLFF